MTALLFTFILASAGQKPVVPPPPLVRVFVKTEAMGDAMELGARRDSVRDLRDALASKKKTISVVSDEDKADVIVEVLERTTTVPKVVFGGGSPNSGPPGTGMAGPVRNVHLRVKLIYGQEFLPFANKNSPIESSGGWKTAAEDIAKQMDKWVAEHRDALLAGR